MKIFVCVKHVPDTEARIRVAADGTTADLAGVKMIVSPFDELALEEALLLKEAGSATEVGVVSAGGEEVQPTLRAALAMGADRAVCVLDPGFAASDPLSRAKALAAALSSEGAELVFTGKLGVGDDDGQVGPMLGELLDRPHVGNVFRLAVDGARFTAWRAIEGAVEVVEGALPAVIAWDKGEHEPRYASLKGIMAAKKKPLAVKPASALGVVPGPPTVARESLELPPPRPAGRLLTGEPAVAAKELARLLRDEAKVI
jgi:electron transfer flavoprotein beta subunit